MEQSTIVVGSQADPVAWIALIFSAGAIGWSIWSELTSYRRRQADEHWYRGVFSPACVTPVIELLNSYLADLDSLSPSSNSSDVDKVFSSFSARKEAVLAKLWLSKLFDERYYDLASEHLDAVEDMAAEKFGSWKMRGAKFAFGSEMPLLRDNAVNRIGIIFSSATEVNVSRFLRRRRRIVSGFWIIRLFPRRNDSVLRE